MSSEFIGQLVVLYVPTHGVNVHHEHIIDPSVMCMLVNLPTCRCCCLGTNPSKEMADAPIDPHIKPVVPSDILDPYQTDDTVSSVRTMLAKLAQKDSQALEGGGQTDDGDHQRLIDPTSEEGVSARASSFQECTNTITDPFNTWREATAVLSAEIAVLKQRLAEEKTEHA